MSNEKKPVIDLRRPSDKGRHTSKEWSEHISLTEAQETARDIRGARQRLGNFTARFFIEAICAGEDDSEELIEQMLQYVDPHQKLSDMDIDPRALKKLAERVGGEKAARVVNNSVLREIPTEAVTESKDVSRQQVDLLRALLKTMDPEVVKRALTGG